MKSGNPKKKYLLTSFGCQMNLADSQRIKAILSAENYEETCSEEDADLILFNTCCVREHAEDRLISRVQTLKPLKKKKPGLIVAVGGCLAQKEKENLPKLLPIVDLAFGPNDIPRLPALLENRGGAGTIFGPFLTQGGFSGEEADGIILERPFMAYVNIIRGCTNFCSYCIVPHVRGPEVSRPLPEIARFVSDLALKGVTEIMVLGQNVNAYGRDIGLDDGSTHLGSPPGGGSTHLGSPPGGGSTHLGSPPGGGFPLLLEKLNSINGIRRIRFLTSHPRDFRIAAIERISRLDKVCEAFHLPLQSGSDRILKMMNRGYTNEEYSRLVQTIRAIIPKASLTTDIICGFPSETEVDFAGTLEMVRKIRFESAFMYYFSPRSGTKAAEMAGLLPEDIRKERLARLIRIQNEIAIEESKKLVGQTLEVLVESEATRVPGHLIGKTRTGRVVDFKGTSNLVGSYVSVEIERARNWTLSGKLCG